MLLPSVASRRVFRENVLLSRCNTLHRESHVRRIEKGWKIGETRLFRSRESDVIREYADSTVSDYKSRRVARGSIPLISDES